MGVSKSKPDEMKNLISKLMHELAIQIDLFYEDQEIGILANEDSTFRVFRRGLQWMDENRMPWSKTIRHVCNRIHGCHAEYFAEPMDDPDIKRIDHQSRSASSRIVLELIEETIT